MEETIRRKGVMPHVVGSPGVYGRWTREVQKGGSSEAREKGEV